MKTHIVDMFSELEIQQISEIINHEKLTKKVFVWNEFAGEPFPQDIVDDKSMYIQNVSLGKIMINNLELPQSIINKINSVAAENGIDADFFCATYTEYSGEYGAPSLTPHKDNMDFLLIDYQIDANTSWPIYVEDTEYDLANNDAVMFLPGRMIHGRIDKEFTNKEYVKMIFFDMKLRDN
jgi:hypothetical protein